MTDSAATLHPPKDDLMTPSRPPSSLERLMIDAVRVLSMDAVQRAESGHPGTPMALAPAGYELFTRHLRHNPGNPGWHDRDRFVRPTGLTGPTSPNPGSSRTRIP